MNAGIGDVLNGRKHSHSACDPRPLRPDSRASQLPRDVEGSSRPLLGIRKLESKRMRMSVNMGTRETRLRMVVTPLGRSSDRPKHLPMRRPSGGAPVVVGDVSDVHKGAFGPRGALSRATARRAADESRKPRKMLLTFRPLGLYISVGEKNRTDPVPLADSCPVNCLSCRKQKDTAFGCD